MNKFQTLYSRFPEVYPEKLEIEFDCNEKYFSLIEDLSEKITSIIKKQNIKNFKVTQVFDKLDYLNFNTENSNDEIINLIIKYESKSKDI